MSIDKRKVRLSVEASETWEELENGIKIDLRRANKKLRNRAIRELKKRGLKVKLISELTGLQRGSIFRVLKSTKSDSDADYLIVERLRGLKRVFESFSNAFLQQLNEIIKSQKIK